MTIESQLQSQLQPEPDSARVESTLPFSGFYESMHSRELDNQVEQLTQDDSGDQYELVGAPDANGERTVTKPGEDLWEHVSWPAAYSAYAKEYAENFAAYVKAETKLDLALEFSELVSPREYNFTTDRIFVTVSRAAVQEIFRRVSMQLLNEQIAAKFTSYDGFNSYYPNTLDAWLGGEHTGANAYKFSGLTDSLDEWDANQVGTLLEAFLVQELGDGSGNQARRGNPLRQIEDDIYEGMSSKSFDMFPYLDDEGKRIVNEVWAARDAD
jgi:hypothetical protein